MRGFFKVPTTPLQPKTHIPTKIWTHWNFFSSKPTLTYKWILSTSLPMIYFYHFITWIDVWPRVVMLSENFWAWSSTSMKESKIIKKMPGTCQMILDLDVNPLQALLRGARERASVSFGRRVTWAIGVTTRIGKLLAPDLSRIVW